MFYCDKCAKDRNYPNTLFKSYGKCELCGETNVCNDGKPNKK